MQPFSVPLLSKSFHQSHATLPGLTHEKSAPAAAGSGRYTFHEPGAPYNTGMKTRPAKAKKGRGMKGNTITLSETEEILKQTGAASIDELVLELESQMLEAAEALEFERAAQLRDRIRSLSKDLDAPPF